jgi:hypothetical protein
VARELTYRVKCPTCRAWSQLRVAESLADNHPDAVIVMFSCPNQTSEDHVIAPDNVLLKLIPAHPKLS